MKKILTFILLFTITLFYSIPSEAYTLNGNDIPLVQTKNLFNETRVGLTYIQISDLLPNTNYTVSTDAPYEIPANLYLGNTSTFILSTASNGMTNTTIRQRTITSDSLGRLWLYINTSTVHGNNIVNGTFYIQLELSSSATSFTPYAILTLNEIFRDGQLLANGKFENGFTSWTALNAGTPIVSNNIATYTATSSAGILFTNVSTVVGNKYFTISNYKASSSLVAIRVSDGATYSQIINSHSGSNEFELNSSIFTQISPAAVNIQIRDSRTSGYTPTSLDYLFLIDITALGIDHLNKATLDNYYNKFELNNAFIEGYNEGYDEGYDDGFNVGYDDGFDDGVASNTSYAVGYALGLSEGQDMETGSSLLILIVAVIGFVMMIFGFATKRGIFNLLSVAAFIVLGGLLVEFVGFIIIAVGLVFINVYYAFFGEL